MFFCRFFSIFFFRKSMSTDACKEEQAMELEVLESLFPVEMQRSPESTSEFSLVGLVPYSDQSQTNFVSIDIKFVFPPLYPVEEFLGYEITKIFGGNIASDSSKIDLLNELIRHEISASGLGSPVVYQVVVKIVEFLREHNQEEKSLHDLLIERGGRESARKSARLARATTTMTVEDDEDEDDDSDWSSDYSDEDSSSGGSFVCEESEDDEEEYKGLQLKNLCAESDRVTDTQFTEWKMEHDKWLMSNGWIKRVAESDLRPTGKQQFLTLLTSRRENNSEEIIEEDFDEELFAEGDAELDDNDLDSE